MGRQNATLSSARKARKQIVGMVANDEARKEIVSEQAVQLHENDESRKQEGKSATCLNASNYKKG